MRLLWIAAVAVYCWVIYSLARWPGMGQSWARLVMVVAMLASVTVVVRQGVSMLYTLELTAGVLVSWYVVTRALWLLALWPEARREDQRFRAEHPDLR